MKDSEFKAGMSAMFGGGSLFMGGMSLSYFADYALSKAAVIQTKLANNVELTDKVIDAAKIAANQASDNGLYLGITSLVSAGVFYGVSKFYSSLRSGE